MGEDFSEIREQVAACHYVCGKAFVFVFIKQAFGIWKPARGFEAYCVHPSVCVCVCVCLCLFVCPPLHVCVCALICEWRW